MTKVGEQLYLKRKLRYLLDYVTSQFDRLFNYAIEKRIFYKKHGYRLNLDQPQSYSEKIIWKKINDQNPLLPITSDKYLVRFYVEAVLGTNKAHEILVPLLFNTDNPKNIPFENLPTEYILSSRHFIPMQVHQPPGTGKAQPAF